MPSNRWDLQPTLNGPSTTLALTGDHGSRQLPGKPLSGFRMTRMTPSTPCSKREGAQFEQYERRQEWIAELSLLSN